MPAISSGNNIRQTDRSSAVTKLFSQLFENIPSGTEEIRRTIYPRALRPRRILSRNKTLHENVIFTGGIKAGSSRMARRPRDRVKPVSLGAFLSPAAFDSLAISRDSTRKQPSLCRSSPLACRMELDRARGVNSLPLPFSLSLSVSLIERRNRSLTERKQPTKGSSRQDSVYDRRRRRSGGWQVTFSKLSRYPILVASRRVGCSWQEKDRPWKVATRCEVTEKDEGHARGPRVTSRCFRPLSGERPLSRSSLARSKLRASCVDSRHYSP